MVRPLKYGESTDWASYRLPGALDRFVEGRAAALGVKKSEALVLILLDVQAEGPAALRSVQHKQEAVELRRQVLTMARDVNALAEKEGRWRKKYRDLAYAYRTLAAAVRMPSDKLRETIRARLASLNAEK
jgi:hypothetical protein